MATTSIITKAGDIMVSGRESEERRLDYVCVQVLVDVTSPRSLVLPVRDAFDPHLPTSQVRVAAAGSDTDLLAPTVPDVCVALLGRNESALVPGVCELAAAGVPVALICESALDAPKLPLGDTAASRVSVISATNADVLLDRLAEWLVGATDKSVAMAANFPFCRRAKVRELIKEYAVENAMGTAKQGPGAELPSMTVNQIRLALAIAAVNGQPLTLGRIPEALTAVATGFGSRMFANKVLGKVPLVGFMLQAGSGYIGTQATGLTLQRRFDKKELRQEQIEAGIEPTPTMTERAASAIKSRITRRKEPRDRRAPSSGVRLLTDGNTSSHHGWRAAR